MLARRLVARSEGFFIVPLPHGCSSEQPFFDDHLVRRLGSDQRSGDLPFVNAALRFAIVGVRWHERHSISGWRWSGNADAP